MALSTEEMNRLTQLLESKKGSNLEQFTGGASQGVGSRIVKDMPSDLIETGEGIVGAVKGIGTKLKEAVTRPGLTTPQRIAGGIVAPLQGVVRGVGEVAVGAGKLLTTDEFEEAVSTKMSEIGQDVTASKLGQSLKGFYDRLPDDQKYTLTNIIAPSAEVMASIGTGGVASGASKVATKGIGTTVKALAGGVESLNFVPKVIKGAGTQLYKSAITPNVKEATQILNYRAKSPFLARLGEFGEKAPRTRSQTALEQGIMGTESMVGVQAKKKADLLWKNEIEPLVKNSDVVMTKDELFTPALERIATIENPTRRKAMERAYESLLEDYADYPDSFSLEQAQKLKRELATFTPSKIFKGQEVASEMRTLQADMASSIRQKTYDSFPDMNMRQKYLDWANLDELENLGIKAISEASFKGGSGTLLSGVWDMATTPIKTVGGQVLYRVGDKLEFTAPKGIKTFGEYMESLGYSKPIPISPVPLSGEREGE